MKEGVPTYGQTTLICIQNTACSYKKSIILIIDMIINMTVMELLEQVIFFYLVIY
jgi:hypothetical protein